MRQRIATFPAIWPSRIWTAVLAMTVLLVSCPGGSGGYWRDSFNSVFDLARGEDHAVLELGLHETAGNCCSYSWA